jgi:hypothetical protein
VFSGELLQKPSSKHYYFLIMYSNSSPTFPAQRKQHPTHSELPGKPLQKPSSMPPLLLPPHSLSISRQSVAVAFKHLSGVCGWAAGPRARNLHYTF